MFPVLSADVANFHSKFGLTGPLTPEEEELRHKRLYEEVHEYREAVEEGNKEKQLDALVDTVYIAIGTANRQGWNFDEAWKRVHAANMAKERGTENNSKYGSTFDIVKPVGWTAPDLSDLVNDHGIDESARYPVI